MRWWARLLGWTLLAGAALVAFCLWNTPPDVTVRMQFPSGFHGVAVVAFDQPAGQSLRWTGNVLHLDFPPSGVLKIREGLDRHPSVWSAAAFWDYEKAMPIPSWNGLDAPPDPKSENVVGLHDGANEDNKLLRYFVGTDKEFRAFMRAGRWEEWPEGLVGPRETYP